MRLLAYFSSDQGVKHGEIIINQEGLKEIILAV